MKLMKLPLKHGALLPVNVVIPETVTALKFLISADPAKDSTLRYGNLWKLLISVGPVKKGTLRLDNSWKLVTPETVILLCPLSSLILRNLLMTAASATSAPLKTVMW